MKHHRNRKKKGWKERTSIYGPAPYPEQGCATRWQPHITTYMGFSSTLIDAAALVRSSRRCMPSTPSRPTFSPRGGLCWSGVWPRVATRAFGCSCTRQHGGWSFLLKNLIVGETNASSNPLVLLFQNLTPRFNANEYRAEIVQVEPRNFIRNRLMGSVSIGIDLALASPVAHTILHALFCIHSRLRQT
jgi:hypothetical protein